MLRQGAVLEVELPTYTKLPSAFPLLFLFFVCVCFLLVNAADRNVRSKRTGIKVGSKETESSDLVLATFVEM